MNACQMSLVTEQFLLDNFSKSDVRLFRTQAHLFQFLDDCPLSTIDSFQLNCRHGLISSPNMKSYVNSTSTITRHPTLEAKKTRGRIPVLCRPHCVTSGRVFSERNLHTSTTTALPPAIPLRRPHCLQQASLHSTTQLFLLETILTNQAMIHY